MSLTVFLLVLLSAVFHASWNFILRKVTGNIVVLWLSLWASSLVALPFTLLFLPEEISTYTTADFFFVLLSGIIHWIYFSLLASAYRYGEISTIYPIARGSGIALTCIFATLFLQEQISPAGLIGIVLIISGIGITSGKGILIGDNRRALMLALGVGVSICGYSVVDKGAVATLPPLLFLTLLYLLSAILMTPQILRNYYHQLSEQLRMHWQYALAVGIGSAGAYLIILDAYTLGPVSYIVAMREFAIVIGVLLGAVFLKERVTTRKWIGVLIIVAGLVFIRIGS